MGSRLVPGLRTPVIIPQPGLDLDPFWDLLLQSFPEHSPVTGLRHVGEDGVLLDRLHGVEVGPVRCPCGMIHIH